MQKNKRKNVVYFIEYSNTIKFFSENGNWLELIKNKVNYEQFKKILNSNQYEFINLLGNED